MFLSLKNNISLVFIMAFWVLLGAISEYLAVGFVLLTLVLFFLKERYYEAFLGFLLLLVLADSYEEVFHFAKVVKPLYLILLALLTFRIPGFLNKNYNFLIRFGPFLIIAIVCIAFSPVPFISIQKVLSYGLLLFAIPNLLIYEYKRYGNRLLVDIVTLSFFVYIICIFITVFFPDIGISHGSRWRGIFGNPNGLGLFLTVYYILFRVVLERAPNLFTKFDIILYYLLSFFLLWMSGSRNALLSFLIFEIIVIGFKYSRPMTVLVLVAVIMFFEYISDFGLSLLISVGLESDLRLENLDEGSGRLIAWQFAFEDIKRGMIVFGKGLGYDEYLMQKNYTRLSRLGHEGGVHNTYLILWLNTGLLGLIAFFSAYFSFFFEAFKKNTFAFASMLAILSSINNEPWLSGSLNAYTSVFLILMVVYLYLNNEDEHEDLIAIA